MQNFFMFFLTVDYSLARRIYKFRFFPVSNRLVFIPLARERVYATVGHLDSLLGHCRAFATVTGHCRRIKRKLNLKSDNAVIRYAVCG